MRRNYFEVFRTFHFSKFIHLLICLLFFSSCSAKTFPTSEDTSAYQLIKEIETDARFIAADKLQQLYIVNTKNEVIKYSPTGKELFRFSNNTLGDLTHIDVTNPFSILLFYPDFLTVYTLDRTLNKTGEYNLFDLNLTDVQAVAMSNDNNVWLYDDVFYRIKKINRNGDVLRESLDLSNQFAELLRPNFILERDNWLYINDPNVGVLVFDVYGQYSKTLEFKNLETFQIMDKLLIFEEGINLKSFHLQSLTIKIIDLPEGISVEDQMIIQKSKLFIKKEKSVEIYEY